ncbi:chemotaxis protein CheW [Pseudoduganella violaceinigra]|uniref:chemotaxis protein CheW n=1 Tax=Pseudoduganella violaceinigra TaxID=246602 RepID=UPI000403F3A5|nr:chemotaxis protein CheW [Pseudoduganella violaceinigra]
MTDQTQDLDACWNRIGVAGDHSCGMLDKAVHCRNCDVYADAALRNLQRPVSAGYLREWAEHFRAPQDAGARHDNSCVAFRIGREWLALPTGMFQQIAPKAMPHKLPHRAARGLRGVVNAGGKLYPCIALADLLDIDESGGEARAGRHTFARMLLVQWEQQAYALPVDELHGILRYAAADLKPPAATINRGIDRYLAGVLPHEDMQIGCLDGSLLGYQLARTLR